MRYRRAFVPGGSYFFTQVTYQRRHIFTEPEAVDTLREAFRNVMSKQAFSLDAMVVLPDHLHCIWTLPPEDSDFATRWRLIKTWFTKHCDTSLHRQSDNARMLRGERTSWQRRYWEHLLRDENDFNHHVDYIHYNPVRHGYVTRVIDWPYSSFRRYVNSGILPEDWGSGGIDLPESVGHE